MDQFRQVMKRVESSESWLNKDVHCPRQIINKMIQLKVWCAINQEFVNQL